MRLFTTICLLVLAQILPAQVRDYNELTKKRGIADYEGMPLIPAEYDDVLGYFFDNDTFYVAVKGDRMGVFDKKGQLTVPFDYQLVELWAAQSQFQGGYARVKKDRRADSGWGILDARTGQSILPEKFEFARAIFPDLLVGRQFADSTMQFFDGKGQPLFQLFGRSAAPGFDENSMLIRRVDRSEYFADKKGNPIFPPNFQNPSWTDGKLVICTENGKVGLVTMAGKIRIPFEYSEIKVQNPGQFLVKNAQGQRGLMNAKGKFIIPLSQGSLYLPNGKPGPIYIRSDVGSDPNFNCQLFDAAGKLLYSNVRISSLSMASELGFLPFNRRNEYYTAEFQGKKGQLVFHNTRGQVLPMPWASILYGSEKHPLIVNSRDQSGLPVDYKAFDLDGKLLYAAPAGVVLVHTRNPRLLLATNTMDNSRALIHLDKLPEKISFEYPWIQPMDNGYFHFKKDFRTSLLDPNGQVLVPATQFISLGTPNKMQLIAFRESHNVRGKLVAVGHYEGVKHPAWVAVNERGETFVFDTEPAPVATPLPAEPMEKLAESREVVVKGEKQDVPILEEMPAKPASDAVFNLVEKSPQFPGGPDALSKFLTENLKYPVLAKKNGIEGRVVVSFIVEKDGSLTDVKTLKDIGGGCGEEALRLVRGMPKWVPGQQNGRVVRVSHALPVNFRLP
jgi:TonB family protein